MGSTTDRQSRPCRVDDSHYDLIRDVVHPLIVLQLDLVPRRVRAVKTLAGDHEGHAVAFAQVSPKRSDKVRCTHDPKAATDGSESKQPLTRPMLP